MKNSKLPMAIGVIFLLAACTGDPRPPEEIVAERAQARWDALVEREFEIAWKYYSPGFREQRPREAYTATMAQRQLKWLGAVVRDVKCENERPRCEVSVRVQYTAPSNLPGVGQYDSMTGVDEIWLQIDGEWWYSDSG